MDRRPNIIPDEHVTVSQYFRLIRYSVDGIAWLLTCFASFLGVMDLLLRINIMPLRDASDPSKAMVLLLFSPVLVLLILIVLRQLPLSKTMASSWFRAVACVFAFLVLNF